MFLHWEGESGHKNAAAFGFANPSMLERMETVSCSLALCVSLMKEKCIIVKVSPWLDVRQCFGLSAVFSG